MASAMTLNPYIHDDCGEREDACPRCLLERGWNQGHATATEAAEAARSQLAVAVEALERAHMFTPIDEFKTTGERIVRQTIDDALAKLRAAKEGP